MDGIAAIREGQGPEILLVHGGASPAVTWAPLLPLQERWSLTIAHRRGYPPSPSPPDGKKIPSATPATWLRFSSRDRTSSRIRTGRWAP